MAEAVETTVATAGRSIFFSGITVVVGLLGLMIIPYMSMRSMGLGGALVVLVSVLAALTLLPALLGMLGPRVDSLRVIGRKGDGELFWRRWSDWVMRHPVPVLIGTIALVVVFAWPVLRIQSDIPGATALPRDSESRQGYDLLLERFDAAALSPVEVLVTWEGEEDPFAPANLERLYAYGRELEALPGVDRVTSIVTLPGMDSAAGAAAFWQGVEEAASTTPREDAAPQTELSGLPGIVQGMLGAEQVKGAQKLAAATTAPGTALLRVVPEAPPTSEQAQALAVDISEAAARRARRTYVAGASLTVHDFVDAIYSRFPWIIAFVVGVTGLVLFLMLRSVVLPVKAVIMNVCSLLAGFGAMVWIFQEGHLEGLFQFTATGAIDAELPVVLFCTVFGVSMDYEVFLLSRMREEWDATHDNVARGQLRARADRPHRHERGADHRRGRAVVRVHVDRRDQGDRHRPRGRRRARRHRHPRADGAGGDAPARALELVAAGLAAVAAAHRVAGAAGTRSASAGCAPRRAGE